MKLVNKFFFLSNKIIFDKILNNNNKKIRNFLKINLINKFLIK